LGPASEIAKRIHHEPIIAFAGVEIVEPSPEWGFRHPEKSICQPDYVFDLRNSAEYLGANEHRVHQ
jgi:hypothetical protein